MMKMNTKVNSLAIAGFIHSLDKAQALLSAVSSEAKRKDEAALNLALQYIYDKLSETRHDFWKDVVMSDERFADTVRKELDYYRDAGD